MLNEDLKAGKIAAYELLMDKYYQNLCAYAFTLIHNHDDAEDIVQNVFTKIWIKRKKINTELSIKSLLYKSVYNEFIDLYRKNKPVTKLERKYIENIESYVDQDSEYIEKLIIKIYNIVDNLPPKCREVFIMNKKEGLTQLEISEYLNISVKTVEAHIKKAFMELKENLGSNSDIALFLLFGIPNPKLILSELQ